MTTHDDLLLWLERNGWRQLSEGALGSLWALGDSESVGIPHALDSRSFEWRGTLERLAVTSGMAPAALIRYFENLRVDEIEFAAGGARGHSIPLRDADQLLKVVMTAVRTTATTAISPRASIGGSYLVRGDRIVDRVDLTHTRMGSFVMPVRYRLTSAALKATEDRLQSELGDGQLSTENLETEERRASRTLMQSMAVIKDEVIRPARLPSNSTLQEITQIGVTSELIRALGDYLRRPEEVDSLRVTAHWAGAVKAPAGTEREVEVSASADVSHLLESVAAVMRKQRKIDGETISGPVVGVRLLEPVDKGGRAPSIATIQGVRKGRTSLIEVALPGDLFSKVTEWLQTGEAVQGHGFIERHGGRLRLNLQGSLRGLNNPTLPIGD